MKPVTLIILPIIFLSGCIGFMQSRFSQELSIRINGDRSSEYTLLYVDKDKTERVELELLHGVHTVMLPEVVYMEGVIIIIPTSDHPEKKEDLVITRDGNDLKKMSIRRLRRKKQNPDGVYEVNFRDK